MVEVPSLTTELSLLDAVQGKYHLGETVATRAALDYRKFADGTDTVSRLIKNPSPETNEPTNLPGISGHLKLVDCRVTVDQEQGTDGKGHSVQVGAINGEATITDINAPIKHALSLNARVDGGKTGTFTLEGTAGLVRDNRVDLDGAMADEHGKLSGIDGAVVGRFLPPPRR